MKGVVQQISSVAALVLLSLAFVFASFLFVGTAHAGTITSIGYSYSGATVGTFAATSTIVAKFTPATAYQNGTTTVLTFPTGTTLASIVTADFAVRQINNGGDSCVSGATTTPSNVAFNAGARTVTITIAGASLSNSCGTGTDNGMGVVYVGLSGTVGGDEIKHPTTVTTTGTFSVADELDSGSISNVAFVPGAAATLAVTGITDPVVAGTASDVVVTAKDQYNNTATGYTGTVHFTSNDSQATLPSNYAFVGGDNGAKTFTGGVTMKTAGEKTVTATDTLTGTITGTQSAITVTHGAASQYVMTDPTDDTIDNAITVTVQLEDAYGNRVTTGGDKDKDVTLVTDGSATGGGVLNIANGVGTLDISDLVAETVNLSLSTPVLESAAVTSSQDVVFAYGAAAKLAFGTQPTNVIVGGYIDPFTVRVLDQGNNLVANATNAITVALGAGSGSLMGTLTQSAVSGTAPFTYLRLDTVASGFTLAASASGLTGATSNAFNVTSGAGEGTTGTGSGGNGAPVGGGGGGGGGSVPVTIAAPAQTASTVTIASLVAQLQTLIATLKSLGGTVSPALEASVNALAGGSSSLSRDLQMGATGDDVKALQVYLNSHGYAIAQSGPGSAGNETTMFGGATRAALIKLQKAAGITPANGNFGPKTRAYIQAHQ